MSTSICYLGIGSNLEHPRAQVARALHTLSEHPTITILRQSLWYSSTAIGPGKQPDYINGVIEIETTLSPQDLLLAVQHIEARQGRTRELRWGARTLDIDILLYGDQQMQTADLEIPHPRILERNFVLVPLAELRPDLPISMLHHSSDNSPNAGKNETIAALLNSVSRKGLALMTEQPIHE